MLAIGISIAALIYSVINIVSISKRNKKSYEESREFNEYLKNELEKLYRLKEEKESYR